MQQGSSINLQQLSYHCPGLHGPGSRQRIERRTFGNFLVSPGETNRIIIPLFQRRYCWDKPEVSRWWKDTVRGTRDHLGIHNSGNVVVKRSENESDQRAWICVDGQQRLTTTCLLVAAIRDTLNLCEETEKSSELLKKLESVLYWDNEELEIYRKTADFERRFEAGQDLEFCRLCPSFSDRKNYFQSVTSGLFDVPEAAEDTDISLQRHAKHYFDRSIAEYLQQRPTEDKIEVLEQLTTLALSKMGLTLVEIQNSVNLPQVFLWLQEKSLFGAGGLLYNPAPGIQFTSSDLIRNLLFASFMTKSKAEQEIIYRMQWLFPIENECKTSIELSTKILNFVERNNSEHISSLEKKVTAMTANKPGNRFNHAVAYAKFYSLYESRLLKENEANTAEHLQRLIETKENTSNEPFSNDVIEKVSQDLLDELKDYFKNLSLS